MKKEDEIRKFLIDNKDNYPEGIYEFLINNYLYYMGYPKFAFDILLQLYSKFGVIDKNNDIYYGIFDKIKKFYNINSDVVEIGSGAYPRLAEIIDDFQTKSKIGTIKAYDPLLAVSKLGNIKLYKKRFDTNTKIKEGSLLIASSPCNATLDIIKKANDEDLEFFIALCGCTHENFKNYDDWINYVFDYAISTNKNGAKIYKDELDKNYDYDYPIIFKKY